jgi:tripeptide aminopeptidase
VGTTQSAGNHGRNNADRSPQSALRTLARKSLQLLGVCCIFIGMAAMPARTKDAVSIERIAQDSRVQAALASFEKNAEWITDEQVRLTEIPAPSFAEGHRAEALRHMLTSVGWKTEIDSAGNVVSERAGNGSAKDVVLIAAHIDTVFPQGTRVRVKRKGTRLEAPGIADNGAGIAALVGLARAVSDANVQTEATLVFAGDTGEEGEGNLRGIRQLMTTYKDRLRAVIAIDGASTDHIVTQGLASRRIEATVHGPGGHSWSDFGAPNAITALARGVVVFSSVSVPDLPRTTFNFGVVEGGTSVNAIPDRASVKIDLRSEEEGQLDRLEKELHTAMQAGIREEMAAAVPGSGSLELSYRSLGVRPAGKLASDAPLVVAINGVDKYLGNRSRLESSSTDANIPLSLGIPAIGIGGGGRAGGSHTVDEWYDTAGRALGLKRALLTVLTVSGVQF